MDVAGILAARREADPDLDHAAVTDARAEERALLAEVRAPLDAAWVARAARVIAAQHAEERGAWALLRVLEPALADLEARDPRSAGRAHAALGTQALIEADAEAFLDRVGRAADALDRAGAARAAAVERAFHGGALLALGMNEEAAGALDRALLGLRAEGLGLARAFAEEARARLSARRSSEIVGAQTNSFELKPIADGAPAGTAAALAHATWLAGGAAAALLARADARAEAGDAEGAAAALAEARRAVLAFASRLRRPAVRKSYLERVPEHRRALSLDG